MPCFKPRWLGTQPTSSKPRNCNRCGKPGHWVKECPNKSQNDANVSNSNNGGHNSGSGHGNGNARGGMSMLAVARPMKMVRTNITLEIGSMLLLLQASLSARLPMELHSSGVASANIGRQATTLTHMASSMKPTCALSLIH